MKETIIEAKKQSAFNLSWWLAPIVALVLLFLGELIGIVGLMWIPILSPEVLEDSFLSLVIELASFAFIALVVVLWARQVEKTPWQGMGLSRKNALKEFLKGWGLGAALLTVTVLVMMLFGVVNIEAFDFSVTTILKFLVLLLAWSIQGTTEEVLCRGWLFTSISAKNNIPVGVIVSSIFFTAIHLGNDGISVIPLLDLTLFAILACLVMLKTNNLWVISGIHAAWNCFQGNVFAFPVSGSQTGDAFIHVTTTGPSWLSGGSFGVEGSMISVVIQGLVIIWLVHDLFLRKDHVSV
ncbi:CPBP family intramembrane glutamic endopeptidase [Streptococcus cameli]